MVLVKHFFIVALGGAGNIRKNKRASRLDGFLQNPKRFLDH
jgi:hypothetical protein